jgi:hypothetical protein
MTHQPQKILLLFLLAAAAAPGQEIANTAESAGALGMDLLAPPAYRAGGDLEVILRITLLEAGTLSALGAYLTLPAGWTFTGMRPIAGRPPALYPDTGTGPVLQFAWIDIPAFPCEFACAVSVPPGEAGVRILSGQIEYRGSGGRLVSPPVMAEIAGRDTAPPEITLAGPPALTIALNSVWEDPGYTAMDNAGGDITDRVVIAGAVDTGSTGVYTLTYTVADAAGNAAQPVTRAVRVVNPEQADSANSGSEPVDPGTATPVPAGSVNSDPESGSVSAGRARLLTRHNPDSEPEAEPVSAETARALTRHNADSEPEAGRVSAASSGKRETGIAQLEKLVAARDLLSQIFGPSYGKALAESSAKRAAAAARAPDETETPAEKAPDTETGVDTAPSVPVYIAREEPAYTRGNDNRGIRRLSPAPVHETQAAAETGLRNSAGTAGNRPPLETPAAPARVTEETVFPAAFLIIAGTVILLVLAAALAWRITRTARR